MNTEFYFFLESLKHDHPETKEYGAVIEAYEVCFEGALDSVANKAFGALKGLIGGDLVTKIQSGIKSKGLQLTDLLKQAKDKMNDPDVLAQGQKILAGLAGKTPKPVTESVLLEATGIQKYIMAFLVVLQLSGALSVAVASDINSETETELSTGDDSPSIAYGKHIAHLINKAVANAPDGATTETTEAMSKALSVFKVIESKEGNDVAVTFGKTVLDNIDNEKSKSIAATTFGSELSGYGTSSKGTKLKLDGSRKNKTVDNDETKSSLKPRMVDGASMSTGKTLSTSQKLKQGIGGGGYLNDDGTISLK